MLEPIKKLRNVIQMLLAGAMPLAHRANEGGSRRRISKWRGKQHEKHAYRRGFRSPFERRSNMISLAFKASRKRLAAANRTQGSKALRPAFE